ncbi:hydroxyacid dehydrogenase [Shouchella shacheensis]|uniref:hydroxyacid dehydrogenase n=1 Tax=Shouchella shacheensis TaxID=1649580 RepID=UPI00074008DF|nr:hydroxyacid dehydrogenase [Shouchella shacheensis]
MIKSVFVMNQGSFPLVYTDDVREYLYQHSNLVAPPMSNEELQENVSILQEVEVIFSGWGGPKIDQSLLETAPHLKAVFYAAGSLKTIATEAAWERGITFTSAYAANAIPVAEYTLSQILFSLKNGWKYVHEIKEKKVYPSKPLQDISGAFGTTVGIISLSTVGRRVCELLKMFDVNVIAYDPFAQKRDEKDLNVTLVSLEEIFERADIVSLHAPWLAETEGMITGTHFQKMKRNASFINTSRGRIVREEEMLEVLRERKDVTAILDVTDPEPPEEGADIFSFSNVILTPHLAGSEERECGRMGAYMLEEFYRYVEGEPLKWQVTREKFQIQA